MPHPKIYCPSPCVTARFDTTWFRVSRTLSSPAFELPLLLKAVHPGTSAWGYKLTALSGVVKLAESEAAALPVFLSIHLTPYFNRPPPAHHLMVFPLHPGELDRVVRCGGKEAALDLHLFTTELRALTNPEENGAMETVWARVGVRCLSLHAKVTVPVNDAAAWYRRWEGVHRSRMTCG